MSTLTFDPAVAQRMRALSRANAVRIGAAQLRRELGAGTISLADALEDERAQPVEIFALLYAQRRWGPRRVRSLLNRVMIGEHRRVRDLTARQRAVLVERAGGGR